MKGDVGNALVHVCFLLPCSSRFELLIVDDASFLVVVTNVVSCSHKSGVLLYIQFLTSISL